MVGWHHQLNRHEFEQAAEDGEGQPGVLQSMGSQTVRQDWGTEQQNSLAGLMLKLKLQYFGHLMQRVNSLEKTLMLGKIEGRRRRGQQRMRCWMASPTRWTWVWASSWRQWRMGSLECCSPWSCKELDMTEQLNHNKLSSMLSCLSRVQLSTTLWIVACQLLCPWDFPGKKTWAGCHAFFWGSSWPRDWTHTPNVCCIDRQVLYH